MATWLGLSASLWLASAPAQPLADAPDEAAIWTEAGTHERAGDYEAAARAFAPLADAYPQDYAIQLQAGWLAFLAEDYAAAESHYATAIELSQGAADARSGLAWTHLRQGHTRAARREFEALLADHPDLASATAGLAELDRRRFAITPSGFVIGHRYAGHPSLDWAAGASVGVSMVVAERVLVSANYRFARYLFESEGRRQGNMQGSNAAADPFDQHTAHVGLGMSWPQAGFLVQAAMLRDGSSAREHAWVVGASARFSPWGDGILDGSAARFASTWVGRIGASWRLPATRWLDVQPGAALQFVAHDVLASGSASVRVHGRVGSLALGGKGGLEQRPVYLEIPAIFAFDGRIRWGAWLVGDVHLGRGVHLLASYELHDLQAPTDAGAIVPTQAHYLALGLSWRSTEAQR